MKPILYTTTALAAAGLLTFGAGDAAAQAKKLTVSVGGFMKPYMGFADNNSSFETAAGTALSNFNMIVDSEIIFKGKTKLDNGIQVAVQVQLESDQRTANSGGDGGSSDNAIDESYLTVSGGFGEVRVGSTKSATFVLKHRAPMLGAIPADNPAKFDFVIRPGGAGGSYGNANASTHIGGSDAMKIVYFTPRFAGFGIGASYRPDNSNSDIVGDNAAATDHSQADVSLTFERKFGDVDVKADVAYWRNFGSTPGVGGAGTSTNTSNWRTGVNIGFAGFTVGGGYRDSDHSLPPGSTLVTSSDLTAWDIGASYRSGPWGVAVSYMHTETPSSIAVAGDDELDNLQIGGSYNIGPGISLLGTLLFLEMDDEGTAPAASNEGWAAIGGIQVRF